MTRAQFLNDLYRRLAENGMNADQAEQHLTYYAEMLADRMEEGMTEEQAVARMEDVDTIARRILEEEGLPFRPVEAVTPPSYPDVSPSGGGGTRAYQAPKKGLTPAQAALWALAILIALGSVSMWLLRNVRAGSNTRYASVEDVAQIPDVPSVQDVPYAEWAVESTMEIPYMSGYEYSGGVNTHAAGSIHNLDIQWAAGTVYVQSWSGDEIQFQEYANTELNERTAMLVEDKGDTLSIRYRAGTSLGSVKGSKWLTVLVPDGMLAAELDIETTSAEVHLQGLEVNELDVSTTSGNIYTVNCYAQSADLSTTSGDMDLTDLHAVELDLETVSGALWGTVVSDDLKAASISGDMTINSVETLESASLTTTSGYVQLSLDSAAARSIDVSSVSGNVSLCLPYDLGFTLEYSTVSGGLNESGGFDMVTRDGKHVYNGGGCEIEVETVSGNLEIY